MNFSEKSQEPKISSERVFNILLGQILEGTLKPGEKLRETSLAKQFGTSRGPVREAIRKLETSHVLQSTPNAGARVIDLSPSELIDLYYVREALEGIAARLAATHITEEEIREFWDLMNEHERMMQEDHNLSFFTSGLDMDFHYRLIRASHNQMLFELLINNLYNLVSIFRQRFTTKERGRIALKQHYRIIEALESRDGELAEILIRRHISDSRRNIERLSQAENLKI